MTSEDSKMVLELATKLANLVKARQLLSDNDMSSIDIEFVDPKHKLHFYKDQILKFDLLEDIFLDLMDLRINEVKGTIQKIVSIGL